MTNLYCRDEIILIGLAMAQLPNLEIHDAPDGVVQEEAYAVQWLQDILNFFYSVVPFSATAKKSTSVTCTANSDTVTLPADFIVDVRNGLLVQTIPGDPTSFKRTMQVSLQKFINRQLAYQNSTNALFPYFYCVVGDDENPLTNYREMLITPTPTINTVCNLWYYYRPPRLEANHKPKFPDDYACIEYVRLRAHEWAGILQPGTAQKFCIDEVARYKAAGLLNEPEDDEIPMDTLVYRQGRNITDNYSWMGQR